MRRLFAVFAGLLSTQAFGLSVTLTTAQKITLVVPAAVTVDSIGYKWEPPGVCDGVQVQFTTNKQQFTIVSGNSPCKGQLKVEVSGTISGTPVTRSDSIDVTITNANAISFTANAPTAK